MKILTVVDRPKSAIAILAADQQKYTPQHDITVLPLHPKRPSPAQLQMVDAYGQQADLIHVAYWRSGEVLKRFGWFQAKPKILVHHNPYDLDQMDWWETYDGVVVKNQTQLAHLQGRGRVYHVPHCIDLDLFQWEDERPMNPPTVGMVAGRIESNKGIQQVAEACNRLNVRFLLVGRGGGTYLENVAKAAGAIFEFRQDVTPRELVEAYHDMHVVVVNSKDGFESGPLIVLEGMATGTPVVSRPVGLVKDIFVGKNPNLALNDGAREDVDNLVEILNNLLVDREQRDRLRYAGYKTVVARQTAIAARMFSQIYHAVAYDEPLVSVIVPTCNRADTLPQVLDAIEAQTYPHLEVIVCDDNSSDDTQGVYRRYRKSSKHTYKYVNTRTNGYNLAMARNLGIVEAEGEIVVFCDDRLAMEPDAISKFADQLWSQGHRWAWGVKDGNPKGFVENFSATWRKLVIAGGMFNERVTGYGAMTRDTHTRFRGLAVDFFRVDDAHAKQVRSSRGWKDRKGELAESRLLLHKLYGG